MRREFIIALTIFVSIIGCEKESNSPDEVNNSTLASDIKIISGNEQTAIYNSTLTDSLVVRVTDKNGNPVSKAPVTFELEKGSGKVSPYWVMTDTLGYAYTYFSTSCSDDYNEVTAYLNDSISNKVDSVTFSVNAYLPNNGWVKSCGIEYIDAYQSALRENNGIFYFLYDDMIYISEDGGLSWNECENLPTLPLSSSFFDIQFNSLGWMYILTKRDGVYYSEDHITWHQINNGIQSMSYPVAFLVEDDCLFASFEYGGLYRSTDNGQNWTRITIGQSYCEPYYFINRHPNGDIYLFDDCDVLCHSTDNGDSWERISLSYKYTHYHVEDFKISDEGDLYIGTYSSTLSVLSSETYEGTVYSYADNNYSSQLVEDISMVDGIVYYTVSYYPDYGIYSSENWSKLDIGFDDIIYSYLLKPDGTFLIVSDDGVYYLNK